MTKKQVKVVVLFFLVLLIVGVYIYYKITEQSRVAVNVYKTLADVNMEGLEANEEQLRRVIKYANKLEKKGDLESIRLCFAIKQSVATTLFTEQFENKFRVWTKETEPLKNNASLDLFCELWDLNQFDEIALLKRIPVDADSILKKLLVGSVNYQDILDGVNFREQLPRDYSKRISNLKNTSYYNKLNNTMKTSDEQFVQTLLVIQDFKDIELIKEAYVQYVNNTNADKFTDKIAWEVDKNEYTRLDNGNINKYMYVSTAIEKYCMMQRKELLVSLAWYLHFYMNNLDCLPDLERKFFEKHRRLCEKEQANN